MAPTIITDVPKINEDKVRTANDFAKWLVVFDVWRGAKSLDEWDKNDPDRKLKDASLCLALFNVAKEDTELHAFITGIPKSAVREDPDRGERILAALANRFNGDQEQHSQHIKAALFAHKQGEKQTFVNYVTSLNQLINASNDSGNKLSEQDKISFLEVGIRNKEHFDMLNTTRDIGRASGTPMSYLQITREMISKESRKQLFKDKTKSTDPEDITKGVTNPNAFAMAAMQKFKKELAEAMQSEIRAELACAALNKPFTGNCFYCAKKGHKIDKCPDKIA